MTRAGLLLFCALLLCACQQVQPWQRDILARPEMAVDPLPLQTRQSRHVRNSREAGADGSQAGGGGCGCY